MGGRIVAECWRVVGALFLATTVEQDMFAVAAAVPGKPKVLFTSRTAILGQTLGSPLAAARARSSMITLLLPALPLFATPLPKGAPPFPPLPTVVGSIMPIRCVCNRVLTLSNGAVAADAMVPAPIPDSRMVAKWKGFSSSFWWIP
eukprot:CAMPEP_0201599006 /NCGR_PEP_ID=MMETSP0492-20130828/639_1 /ASSEMBLY_ACC=CAM_ASM_000837 /TAXON_ID=420259 /ORGANISM="Thalassiosira gravida, Strain GMp14c1" /LENGTH=145 /DNA_ID=CAMNT_0048061523 /DNA_START=170 /DNA_END=607 /DNA_ORIENTATION=+